MPINELLFSWSMSIELGAIQSFKTIRPPKQLQMERLTRLIFYYSAMVSRFQGDKDDEILVMMIAEN